MKLYLVGAMKFTLAEQRLSSIQLLAFLSNVFLRLKTSCIVSLLNSQSTGFAITVFSVKYQPYEK